MSSADPNPALQLRLTRAPQAQFPGAAAVPLSAFDAALLAWLAIEGPTPRNRLAQLLWPDRPEDAARNSLRQRLFQLKKQCGAELVLGQATLSLAPGVVHDLDGASALLADTVLPASGDLAQWLDDQRQRLVSRRRDALGAQADASEAAQDWAGALGAAQELLALEPQSERAHRRLMRLHYLAGDRAAALLAFDRCERVLKDEVGARPSAETLALLATVEAARAQPAPTGAAAVPPSVLRPPRLVGRDREFAALQQAWAASHVVALVGEAGLGKTRLLQEFAAAQGATLYAAGRPGDAGVPFATLARLLRAVAAGGALDALPARARREIARVLPGLDGAALQPVPPGQAAPGGPRLPLLRAVQDLLLAHAPAATVVVDDLHFADDASLDLLRGLVDGDDSTAVPAGAPSLRWVLAWRPAETGSSVQGLHDGLAEQARVAAVPLAPLDQAALADLVDSLALPGVRGHDVAVGLLQRTGGNPLFVLETLKQAWVERRLAQLAESQQLPRPQSVGRLIERRITQLSPAALALARVASIAGPDFGIELAESVLQAGAMQFADALNELEAAQVLRGTAFAHDLVFECVRDSVPRAIAELTHARVAAWLEPRQGEPARIARHWLDAGRDEQALPWLGQAAERAGAALRRREQIDFLDRKSRIEEALGRLDQAFDSLMLAAEIEVTLDDGTNRADGTLARCDRLDALASDASRRVRAATQRSNLAEMRGFHEEAERVAGTALREALRAGVDARSLAQCRLALGTALSGQERPEAALVHFEAALDWVRNEADDAMRCEFHGNLATTYDRLGRLDDGAAHHQQAIQLARHVGDYTNQAICLSNLASNRARAGLLADADRLLDQAQLVYVQAAEPSAIAGFIAIEQTVTHRQLGHYARALRDVEDGLRNLDQFAPGYRVGLHAHEAAIWAHLGQWARFEQVVEVVSGSQDPPRAPVRLALLRHLADVSLGRPGDTAGLLSRLAQTDVRGALDFRHQVQTEQASLRADAAALAELQAVAAEAAAHGHGMSQLLALARAASLGAERGLHTQALRDAHAAWALVAQVTVVSTYPLDAWAHCARAFQAGGDAAALATVARAAREWIDRTTRDHVPEAFRDSFRHRNPFNRELLALATRLGV